MREALIGVVYDDPDGGPAALLEQRGRRPALPCLGPHAPRARRLAAARDAGRARSARASSTPSAIRSPRCRRTSANDPAAPAAARAVRLAGRADRGSLPGGEHALHDAPERCSRRADRSEALDGAGSGGGARRRGRARAGADRPEPPGARGAGPRDPLRGRPAGAAVRTTTRRSPRCRGVGCVVRTADCLPSRSSRRRRSARCTPAGAGSRSASCRPASPSCASSARREISAAIGPGARRLLLRGRRGRPRRVRRLGADARRGSHADLAAVARGDARARGRHRDPRRRAVHDLRAGAVLLLSGARARPRGVRRVIAWRS